MIDDVKSPSSARVPDRTVSAPEGRKAYHPPALEDYGEVSELTRSGPTNTYPDGGGFSSISIP